MKHSRQSCRRRLAVLVLLAPCGVFAATYYADCGWGVNGYDGTTNVVILGTNHGPKLKITGALAAVSSGDVIEVASGFYQEATWDVGQAAVTLLPQRTVTIYASDPWTTDSDGDGLPDAWEVKYQLDPFSTNGVDGATGDPDNDGLTNLQEFENGSNPYNADNEPPIITFAPQPNNSGWYSNDVTITFNASDDHTNFVWLTPHEFTITGETNDCEISASAQDSAGNIGTEYAFVNIDKTPPRIVSLIPGHNGTNDWSNPLLSVAYEDPVGANTNVVPSGLNLDSLQIMLGNDDVTTNFYRQAAGAVWSTNLSQGTYTWSVSVRDYADNLVSTSVMFYATGVTNASAPQISNLNVTNAVILMPDVPEIWLQGNVTGTDTVVYASVNGGEPIPLNRWGDAFGYRLPLEYGTNFIALATADAGEQNVGAQLLIVERTDKFYMNMSAPSFGGFANGSSLTAAGTVSLTFAAGTDEGMGLSSLTINGVAAAIGSPDQNGNVLWSTASPINLVNGQPNTTALPVTATLCWTNGTTTVCRQMPLGLEPILKPVPI
jgi:hypothetical protein